MSVTTCRTRADPEAWLADRRVEEQAAPAPRAVALDCPSASAPNAGARSTRAATATTTTRTPQSTPSTQSVWALATTARKRFPRTIPVTRAAGWIARSIATAGPATIAASAICAATRYRPAAALAARALMRACQRRAAPKRKSSRPLVSKPASRWRPMAVIASVAASCRRAVGASFGSASRRTRTNATPRA
jgi:hypothetical protein